MTMLTRRGLLGGAAAIAAASAVNTQAHSAAPMAGKQGPSFYRYKIGDFEVTALNEGAVRNATPQNMALNKSLPEIQKALGDAFLPTDHVINQFNVVVVNTGKNLVLLDSGFGDNGAPSVGNLLSNMNAAGIDPKNIATILVSHFHGDHINGIRAKAGAANFPNAEIMVSAPEWKHWTDAGEESKAPQVWKGNFGAVKRVFEPIAKDVKQYEYGKELVPGITAVDARGHSPGHTAFLVSSGNGKLLVTSDTVNHQILVRNPEWALWADMDPGVAAASRKRLLDMAAADKIQIAAYHLPFPSTGFISKQGSGYEFHPAYWQPTL
jgi:glyoxylase-like metal-dependent hydrolase (beta-lactamase superfamily II)